MLKQQKLSLAVLGLILSSTAQTALAEELPQINPYNDTVNSLATPLPGGIGSISEYTGAVTFSLSRYGVGTLSGTPVYMTPNRSYEANPDGELIGAFGLGWGLAEASHLYIESGHITNHANMMEKVYEIGFAGADSYGTDVLFQQQTILEKLDILPNGSFAACSPAMVGEITWVPDTTTHGECTWAAINNRRDNHFINQKLDRITRDPVNFGEGKYYKMASNGAVTTYLPAKNDFVDQGVTRRKNNMRYYPVQQTIPGGNQTLTYHYANENGVGDDRLMGHDRNQLLSISDSHGRSIHYVYGTELGKQVIKQIVLKHGSGDTLEEKTLVTFEYGSVALGSSYVPYLKTATDSLNHVTTFTVNADLLIEQVDTPNNGTAMFTWSDVEYTEWGKAIRCQLPDLDLDQDHILSECGPDSNSGPVVSLGTHSQKRLTGLTLTDNSSGSPQAKGQYSISYEELRKDQLPVDDGQSTCRTNPRNTTCFPSYLKVSIDSADNRYSRESIYFSPAHHSISGFNIFDFKGLAGNLMQRKETYNGDEKLTRWYYGQASAVSKQSFTDNVLTQRKSRMIRMSELRDGYWHDTEFGYDCPLDVSDDHLDCVSNFEYTQLREATRYTHYAGTDSDPQHAGDFSTTTAVHSYGSEISRLQQNFNYRNDFYPVVAGEAAPSTKYVIGLIISKNEQLIGGGKTSTLTDITTDFYKTSEAAWPLVKSNHYKNDSRGSNELVKSFAYDAMGQLISESTGLGFERSTTRYESYNFGVPQRTVANDGAVTTSSVNYLGLTKSKSAQGVTLSYEHDELDRLVKTHYPAASGELADVVEYSDFETIGHFVKRYKGAETDRLQQDFIDGFGRQTRKNQLLDSNLSSESTTTYDALGLVESTFIDNEQGGITSKTEFDVFGRPLAERTYSGTGAGAGGGAWLSQTLYSYKMLSDGQLLTSQVSTLNDNRGDYLSPTQQLSVTDIMGRKTWTGQLDTPIDDAQLLAHVQQQVCTHCSKISYSQDSDGTWIKTVTPYGDAALSLPRVTKSDWLGRVLSQTDPELFSSHNTSGKTSFNYNSLGQMVKSCTVNEGFGYLYDKGGRTKHKLKYQGFGCAGNFFFGLDAGTACHADMSQRYSNWSMLACYNYDNQQRLVESISFASGRAVSSRTTVFDAINRPLLMSTNIPSLQPFNCDCELEFYKTAGFKGAGSIEFGWDYEAFANAVSYEIELKAQQSQEIVRLPSVNVQQIPSGTGSYMSAVVIAEDFDLLINAKPQFMADRQITDVHLLDPNKAYLWRVRALSADYEPSAWGPWAILQ